MKTSFEVTSLICQQCKGSCWNPDSQKATQAAVLQKFGIIANNCVNNSDHTARCPYAKSN